MQLTGQPFLILTIILVPVSLLVTLVLWGRVGGPKPVQFLARLVMLLFCQVTAVAMIFVMVNNANMIYGSWDDLLGDGGHISSVPNVPTAAVAGANGAGANGQPGQPGNDAAKPARAKVIQQFKPVDDPLVPKDVQTTDLKGTVSGVDGEVNVWLPPQYNDPAYKNTNFPVVELFPGFPGSSKTWFGSLKVSEQLAPLMKSGQVTPFILISPRTQLISTTVDTGCANVPGKVNADTWLSTDVPQMILDNFRADPSPNGWAVGGFSAGAACADRMALLHPDRYRAAVSLSGYNEPSSLSSSLTAKDPHLNEISNPLYILKHAATPPNVALYQSGDKGDGYEDGQALAAAAKPPTTVKVLLTTGPHTPSLWRPMVPDVFKWLTTIIPAPKPAS
ncbi:esterase family protein [Kitasatospora sp. NBC_01250]|uniref:alpha/beta hydrolase n=1 Tax=unclassified Kitasatospora TaxID=2633591 RepID=UPI002E0FD9DE|nr:MULTISPECIES: alpha/beta hydrolase-fold protein [unclassified Kitasatospora]WSJ66160.1 esterase family protein [Kitasatospora sp. NBC_01302]